MTQERCDNCRFFNSSDIADGYAACRRYPPVLSEWMAKDFTEKEEREEEGASAVYHAQSWIFPQMRADNWCGEWKPKEDA